jgi:hypothetical protein
MMIVMPSNHSSIATCLYQKPMGNAITDPRRKKIKCKVGFSQQSLCHVESFMSTDKNASPRHENSCPDQK